MQRIDLKGLIRLIDDQKDIETNLILDEGCVIEAEDQKPLIKILNYIINYLASITDKPLAISLDLMGEGPLMTLMAYTDTLPESPLSPNVAEALKNYNASLMVLDDSGSYVQVKIQFKK